MSKKNFLFGIIFIFIGFYSFACPHLNDKNPGWCEVARVYADSINEHLRKKHKTKIYKIHLNIKKAALY